jgi:hypothetical protein
MTLRRSDVALDDDQRAKMLDVVSGEAERLARRSTTSSGRVVSTPGRCTLRSAHATRFGWRPTLSRPSSGISTAATSWCSRRRMTLPNVVGDPTRSAAS